MTAEKLSILNKSSQCSYYLEKASYSFKYLDEAQIMKLFKILETFQNIEPNLKKLEILTYHNGNDTILIDNIFDVLLKRTESILRSKTILIFVLDYYRSFKDIMDIKTKPENERSSTEVAKLNRVNKIYEVLIFINDTKVKS